MVLIHDETFIRTVIWGLFSRQPEREPGDSRLGRYKQGLLLYVLLLVMMLVGVSIYLLVRVLWVPAMAGLGLITAAIILVAVAAADLNRPLYTAGVIFVSLAIWSGAVGFVQVLGARAVSLTTATVQLTSGYVYKGYYLDRNADYVMLAVDLDTERPNRVVTIGTNDIALVVLGQLRHVDTAKPRQYPEVFAPVSASPEPPQAPALPTPTVPSAPSDEPSVTPDPTSPPPSRRSPPAPPNVMAVRSAKIADADPVVLSMYPLTRSRGNVMLNFTLANKSKESISIAGLQQSGADAEGLGAVALYDSERRTAYTMAKMTVDDRCLCEPRDVAVTIGPGQERHIAATFEVPVAVAGPVDLLIPYYGWITSVAIS